MLQIHKFPDCGFVVHKAFDGKTSAWFDRTGRLLDAEFRDSLGRSRPVKFNSARAEALISLGRRLANEEAK